MLIVRFLNSRNGISASSPIRHSAKMNAMTPRIPTVRQVSDRCEPQPQVRPCSASVSSGTSATIRKVAPHQSIRWSRRKCGSFRVALTTNSAAMPIGTLTRKTQRQPAMPRMVA